MVAVSPAGDTTVDLTERKVLPATWRFIRRWPLIPGIIVFALVISALFAPLIAPHDPLRGDLLNSSGLPPVWDSNGSTKFLLGTDIQGRDILSRVIHGARVSMSIAAVVLISGGVIGTVLGMIAGYYGG